MTGSEPPSPKPLRRWFLPALVFFALGAATNVAVAWALAYRLRPEAAWSFWNYQGPQFWGWIASCTSRVGVVRVDAILTTPNGYQREAVRRASPWVPRNMESPPSWSMACRVPGFEAATVLGLPEGTEVCEFAHGLPLPCMVSRSYWDQMLSHLPSRTVFDGIPTGRHGVWGEPILLPITPLPAAFALNAVVHAGVISVVFFGVLTPVARLVRRLGRRRPGQCRGCGYDLAGLSGPVCPECGRPLPSTKKSAGPA